MAGQRLSRAKLLAAGCGCAALVVGAMALSGIMGRRAPILPVPRDTRPVPLTTPAPASAEIGGYWKDPSFTPEQLERAYPSSSRPLPPKALPQRSHIYPPKTQATRLRRQIRQGEVTVQ